MKRKDFIKFLESNSCSFLREGANHTIYINIINSYKSSIPRHTELKNNTCKEICKQLEIPSPF